MRGTGGAEPGGRNRDLCLRQFRARREIQKGDRDAGDGLFVVRADGRVLYQRVVGCVMCLRGL